VALLVLAAIKNPRWAIAYLLVFGVGTIAGMMLITVALVFPFAYTANDSAWMNRNLRMASGLVSLGLGIFVVYQIGIVYGLFSAHPRWTPK
jgi:high-affinity nickel-transport protein